MNWWRRRRALQLGDANDRRVGAFRRIWTLRWVRAFRLALDEFRIADHYVLRSSADRLMAAILLLPLETGEPPLAGTVLVARHPLYPRLLRRVTVVGHAEKREADE